MGVYSSIPLKQMDGMDKYIQKIQVLEDEYVGV